jgi:hypothetical protein
MTIVMIARWLLVMDATQTETMVVMEFQDSLIPKTLWLASHSIQKTSIVPTVDTIQSQESIPPQNESDGFIKLVNHNWEAAKKVAEKMAEDCKCDCKEIIARFACKDPFNDSQFERIKKASSGGSLPNCGTTEKFSCKKNSKP